LRSVCGGRRVSQGLRKCCKKPCCDYQGWKYRAHVKLPSGGFVYLIRRRGIATDTIGSGPANPAAAHPVHWAALTLIGGNGNRPRTRQVDSKKAIFATRV
jgi:hypothetical protein